MKIGKLIKNRYKLLDKVGAGGMAVVYIALDSATGKTLAIKVLNENLTSDSRFVSRFEREANIGKSLTHPGIARVIDYGKDGEYNEYFLIMEYVQGITLSKYIKQKGKLSLKETINITIQILSALSYAYSKGIQAHRDIKPGNIMIEADTNRVKVMDFGIAKTVNSHLTHSTVLYTPGYASPEQLVPSKYNNVVDKRSDIYSLGILMYQMLTGELPFKGETPFEVVTQQLTSVPPSPSSINKDIPVSISNIILKCINPNPNNRYQSPEELINELQSETYPEITKSESLPSNHIPTEVYPLNTQDTSDKTVIAGKTTNNKSDAKYWLKKGDKYYKQNNYQEAIKCYDKALEIDPKDVYAWGHKGNAFDSLGNYDEAIKCYNKVLEIGENDSCGSA